MLNTYKVEIKPTAKQTWLIDSHISGCCLAYNLFLDINKQRYEQDYYYLDAYAFNEWFNHEYLEANPDDMWIKNLYDKSVKQAFIDADVVMKRFFNKQSVFPHWRSFKYGQGSYYFVKNSKTSIISCQHHRIELPKLGWVCLKEVGCISTNADCFVIKQGWIKFQAGRYYLTCLVE